MSLQVVTDLLQSLAIVALGAFWYFDPRRRS